MALTALFFMWGFITVMNDFLINSFKSIFDLSPTELSVIQLSFFGSFFCISLVYFILSNVLKSDPINKIGYKNGMAISLVICGVGCASFYFAAAAESYSQFIVSLFILAAGVTCLQICANPYAAILGPENSASSRLNLAQGLNSLGTTIGPIVGNILIYVVFIQQSTLDAIGSAYLIYGIIFISMAIAVSLSKMPNIQDKLSDFSSRGIFQNRNLRFGILAIFCYVGSEVAIGSWIGTLAKDPEIMNASEQAANAFLAFFWGGLMIGRLMASISLNEVDTAKKKNIKMMVVSVSVFILIWMVNGIQITSSENTSLMSFHPIDLKEMTVYIVFLALNYCAFIAGKGRASRMIVIFCSINFVLITLGILVGGSFGFWCILGTGLFFSIGWSNIFTLSIKGLGNLTSQGSSLLVMAIVGGAILPYSQSIIIEHYTVQTSFIVPAIAMLYLIYYGIDGHKIKPELNKE